uniref:MAK10-like protein n=1 Tax=Tanacetum cinerariifolium TaxID=118510 RepID=A0A6L2M295_TANCI|nr:MAK10-like protein [Tanacetum cinerariifolium]
MVSNHVAGACAGLILRLDLLLYPSSSLSGDDLGLVDDELNRRAKTYLAHGWILEEMHVNWAHLEKKRTRLQTYTKSFEDLCIQWLAGIKRRRRDISSDGVRNFGMASGHGRLKEDLESSTWRCRQGSITTWEDLTTRFLAQFFPSGRTVKLRNDILIQTSNQAAGVKLRDKNTEESWALLEDLALYENESWNDPGDFTKPVKAIPLPQDVLSTSDCRLIELENQVSTLYGSSSCSDATYSKDEAKEEGNVKTSTTEYEDHEMTIESKKEFEEETEDEIEKEKEDSPKHFDTFLAIKELRYHERLLKNPRPPWVKAKVSSPLLSKPGEY